MEFNPRSNRKGFQGSPDSPQAIYEATCQSLLLPGHPNSESDEPVLVSIRDSNGNETQSCHDLSDPYRMNCIFPNETVQVVFDPSSGQLIPNGSNGLIRRVRALTAIGTGVDSSSECELLSQDKDRETEVVGTITVFGDGTAVSEDQEFWAIFRRDVLKPADDDDFDPSSGDKQLKKGATGVWYVQQSGNTSLNGVVHGTAEFDFDADTINVSVTITLSKLEHVAVGDTVQAINYIGYEGDEGGECFVYYHGDGTGNEDGTFSLMGARCPA